MSLALPRVDVPDRRQYNPTLGAWMHTGTAALDAADTFHGGPVAIDTETVGFSQFAVKCVTAAWWAPDGTVTTVLLDPMRVPGHGPVLAGLLDRADQIVLHNAAYDLPAMYHHRWMSLEQVGMVTDTLVLAHMLRTPTIVRNKLEVLAGEYLGLRNYEGGLERAFKAAGFSTIEIGHQRMDIDAPTYRHGAMADTVATLRLEPLLRAALVKHLTDHPFATYAATDADGAAAVIASSERTHALMLARTAVGIAIDADYLDNYREQVHIDREDATELLTRAGLAGGSGKGTALMEYLERVGDLPEGWPRTPRTGRPKATKELLDDLDADRYPLVGAQRTLANTDKVLGYLAKVEAQAAVTGRCHPQVTVHGASATGRWSVSQPEYHQFPKAARPVFVTDHDGTGAGLWSIDWTTIEPVYLGNMAGGDPTIDTYEAGGDLYEPLMRAAGVSRDLAKTGVLATLYGQGIPSMARRIGHTQESASQIRRQLLNGMPASARFMRKITHIAETYGMVPTVGGRILTCDDPRFSYKAVNWMIQGSAADQLNHAVECIADAGLAHTIVVGMHDELVVDCDEITAARIERLMQRPHPNLATWAGRTPILRTDRQAMGRAWTKV